MITIDYVAKDGSCWNDADLCRKYEALLDKEDTTDEEYWEVISADSKIEDNITLEEVR